MEQTELEQKIKDVLIEREAEGTLRSYQLPEYQNLMTKVRETMLSTSLTQIQEAIEAEMRNQLSSEGSYSPEEIEEEMEEFRNSTEHKEMFSAYRDAVEAQLSPEGQRERLRSSVKIAYEQPTYLKDQLAKARDALKELKDEGGFLTDQRVFSFDALGRIFSFLELIENMIRPQFAYRAKLVAELATVAEEKGLENALSEDAEYAVVRKTLPTAKAYRELFLLQKDKDTLKQEFEKLTASFSQETGMMANVLKATVGQAYSAFGEEAWQLASTYHEERIKKIYGN